MNAPDASIDGSGILHPHMHGEGIWPGAQVLESLQLKP